MKACLLDTRSVDSFLEDGFCYLFKFSILHNALQYRSLHRRGTNQHARFQITVSSVAIYTPVADQHPRRMLCAESACGLPLASSQ